MISPSRADGLVRPLLLFRKDELAQWIEGRLTPHHDASNLDTTYDRSWIRHGLMPVLRDRFGPAVDDHLLAVCRHAAADQGAWRAVLRELPGLDYRLREGSVEVDRGPLLKYDKGLSEAVLRAMAHDVGCVLGPWRAARLRAFIQRAQSGRTFEIGQGWLAETREVGAQYLVTAHHADDQIETVLFRLLRGTGLAGMAGIAPSRADGLVRPLLLFRKDELAQWIEGRLTPHHDASNLDTTYDRSWIRHGLMPVLRDRFGPAVDDHLLAVCRHAAADQGAWRAVLRELPGLDYRLREGSVEVDRGPLLKYDKGLSEAVLRAMAHDVGCVLGPWRAARLRAFIQRAQSGRTFEIGQGWLAEITFARLRIFRMIETPVEPTGTTFVWDRTKGGRLGWGRWTFSWDREPAGEPQRVSFSTWIEGDPASVRGLASGDRIRPVGGVGRRRVSRLLMEGRVPRSQRAHYPIVYRDGEIIWVPGVCRGSSALPRPGELAVRLDASIS